MQMETVFPEIEKRFSFMRLPMAGEQVDIPQTMQMVDAFLAAGFHYFDTAHGYLNGQSEKENSVFMRDFQPLSEREQAAVSQVRGILRAQSLIPCTGCRYCTEVCPMEIPIPDLFACLNDKRRTGSMDPAKIGGKPHDCMDCGKCEEICPQHLRIRELARSAWQELEL